MTSQKRKHPRTIARKRRKLLFVERFGGKCCICGYNKCIDALDFHHIHGNKKYTPTHIIYMGSVERAEEELKKCILVCANCHRELHSHKYDISYLSKKLIEWQNVNCPVCKKDFLTKDLRVVYCSDRCYRFSTRIVKDRPSSDELNVLIQEYNWTELGKMFNVSDNAVRKWARGFGLIT